MKAWTDYPFIQLGDLENKKAPIREIEVVSYDDDKYCDIIVKGIKTSIKAAYIYSKPGRIGKALQVKLSDLRKCGS